MSEANFEWRAGNKELGVEKLRDLSIQRPDQPYIREALAGLLPFDAENYEEAWQNYQAALRSGPLSSFFFKSAAFALAKRVNSKHANSALTGTTRIERVIARTRSMGAGGLGTAYGFLVVLALALQLYGERAPAVAPMSLASLFALWMIYANDRAMCIKCRNQWIKLFVFSWVVFLLIPHASPYGPEIAIGGAVGFLVAVVPDIKKRKFPPIRIARRAIGCAIAIVVLVLAAENSHVGIFQKAATSSIALKSVVDALALSPSGKYAYLVGINQSYVTTVNLAGQSLSRLPVNSGANVTDVAVSPNGSQIYVTGDGSGTAVSRSVYVLDAMSGRTLGTVDVGGSSTFVAFNPNGRIAYVGADSTKFSSGEALLSIDVETRRVIAAVPIGTGADVIAVNPNGKYVYVASNATSGGNGDTPSEIQVIDLKSNKVVATFGPKDSSACGLAVNPKGTFLYATFCEYNGVVANGIPPLEVISTSTNALTSSIAIPGGSRGIVVSPDGRYLYTALDTTYGLDVINTSTNSSVGTIPVPKGNPLGSLNLLSMNASGRNIYAATWGIFSNAEFLSIALTSGH